jgi:ornithine cyclodeaminase/alanine dehydrogenase-like protein (mu-crystallin family)
MRVMTEDVSTQLITDEIALAAAREAFLASSESAIFPSWSPSSDRGNRFTLKAGATTTTAGVKIGGYWPGNTARGIPRHSSTVVLLDQDTGRVGAIVEASTAYAYRTAAADALAVQALSRDYASVPTIIGTEARLATKPVQSHASATST